MTKVTLRTSPCKKELIFYLNCVCRSVKYIYWSKILLRRIRKISHCRSHSPEYVEHGNFTLLFYRGPIRNVSRFKMHVQLPKLYQLQNCIFLPGDTRQTPHVAIGLANQRARFGEPITKQDSVLMWLMGGRVPFTRFLIIGQTK